MKLIRSIIAMAATALAVMVGYAGDSAPFRLDTMEGNRIARETEKIAYSTEWDNGGKVIVAVDGVTLKEASAPASGDVTWNARNASLGNHTFTHTTYKDGVADKVETVTFTVKTFYTITFNANGGSLGTANPSNAMAEGTTVGMLPVPTRTGYTFVGWFTAAEGGEQISAEAKVTSGVTYYAHWTTGGGAGGGSDDGTGGGSGGGGSGGGSGSATSCYASIEATDIVAPYEVPKAVVLKGAVYNGCDVAGIIELKLGKVNAKKKTSKVSGTLTTLDGKKHKIASFNLTEIDGTSPKAVTLEVKDFGTMSITVGGTQFAGSMGKYHVQSADVGGDWTRGGAKVYVDGALGDRALPAGTLEDLLPDGVPVAAVGGKWKFAKAASVKWAKPKKGAALPERYDAESGKGLVIDTSKGDNL